MLKRLKIGYSESVCYSNYCFYAQKGLIKFHGNLLSKALSPCLFSEKILTYCLFWGIYDIRLSLTLNNELFRYKNSLIIQAKIKKEKKEKTDRKFYGKLEPTKTALSQQR